MTTSTKTSPDMRIVVSKNGPYEVFGEIPLHVVEIVPKDRFSWDWKTVKTYPLKKKYSLCRCGKSKSLPFCDKSHETNGFNGTEKARNIPYAAQAETFDGPTLLLSDAEEFCAFARFCDPGGKIWNLIEQTDNPEARNLVIREAMHCPSGRLTLHDKKTGEAIEDPLEPAICLIEDPALRCSGALWIQGGIPIESAEGKLYERRNRMTLCRCGTSDNKPFCNGSHASIKFKDGIMG